MLQPIDISSEGLKADKKSLKLNSRRNVGEW